ncbi:MAG: class F420-dependent oxidoreductase [Dehalococcoidia bacterium]|nr:class F420-dependent oxidoreductase [Dehalococcoidia bacterium]
MLSDKVRAFVTENHRGVMTTFRRSGAAQMSIVSCGPYGDGVAFATGADRAKLANLKRDPRCTLLVSQPDWRGYVVLEGRAMVMSLDNTGAEELRLALHDLYRATSGREHPNWDEYDQVTREQGRSAIIVVPEHVYGTGA